MRIDEKRLDIERPDTRPVVVDVSLISGSRIKAVAVRLYERAMVEQVLDLRVNAFTLLQADAAALLTQDDWAVTPDVLVNAVHRRVSPKKAERAESLLREAETLAGRMRDDGRFVRTTDIRSIDCPYPHLWFYSENVIERHDRGLFGGEVEEEVERQWIHSGGPFVTVRDEQGIHRDLRWSSVEQYRLVYAE
jgi:hypothetical protein